MTNKSISQDESFFQTKVSPTSVPKSEDQNEPAVLASRTLVGNAGSPPQSKKRMQLELLEEIMKETPDMNKLRMLQTFDVDYSVKDPQSGVSILHHAAFHGEIDLLQLGLDAGLLVDESTKLGRTPLHLACAGNQRSAVCFLLKHGANINAQTCAGLTPLHLAVRENAVAAIKSLLFSRESEGKIAEIELEDMERKTPLSMATNKQVKEMLLRYKRSLNNNAIQADRAPVASDQ